MDATSNESSIYADEIWVWNPATKTHEQVTGGGGGGGGGITAAQLNAAVAPKANTAAVTSALASKADAAAVTAGLMLKADKASPTFTGEAIAANLTVNGNLTMTQTGKPA